MLVVQANATDLLVFQGHGSEEPRQADLEVTPLAVGAVAAQFWAVVAVHQVIHHDVDLGALQVALPWFPLGEQALYHLAVVRVLVVEGVAEIATWAAAVLVAGQAIGLAHIDSLPADSRIQARNLGA